MWDGFCFHPTISAKQSKIFSLCINKAFWQRSRSNKSILSRKKTQLGEPGLISDIDKGQPVTRLHNLLEINCADDRFSLVGGSALVMQAKSFQTFFVLKIQTTLSIHNFCIIF